MGEILQVIEDLSGGTCYQTERFTLDHFVLPEYQDAVQRKTGMIQHTKEGFTFVHRSLWEYFTALALQDKSRDFIIRRGKSLQSNAGLKIPTFFAL